MWRQNVGKASPIGQPERVLRYGLDGAADISGIAATCCPNCGHGPLGGRIELEVKRPGEKPSDDQVRYQRMIERYGGVYVVVRSEEEAEAVMAEVMRR